MGLLIDTDAKQAKLAHRAAKLYSFGMNIYRQLVGEGLDYRTPAF